MANSSASTFDEIRGASLGATWDGKRTRFALLAPPATAAWLCLFDKDGLFNKDSPQEIARLPMDRMAEGLAEGAAEPRGLWQLTIPNADPGQIYGFRVDGTYDPSRGLLCDPAQLLFDPYARDYFFPPDGVSQNNTFSPPLARVIDGSFDWREDRLPKTPWQDTVVYELHVKGMTALHPQLPPELRGTYLGLAEPCVIDHLKALGVTAVELLPIFFSLTEERLLHLGLSNYWGYNTLGFFAPDRRFCATDDPVREVKTMVRAFHRAGIEVILDVAYNHTAEGGQGGPTLSLKGLDNRGYYRLGDDDPELYENFSGCGNTLDARSAIARRLVLDSLRYWAQEMRVDGFRFDLAVSLGRRILGPTSSAFSSEAPFFQEISRDPLLSHLKLVAEPWDLGPNGYRLGEFPAPWREWNDRYRDTVRSFWRGDRGRAPELAQRLTESSDLFSSEGSRSINFITCHDGFTLRDLVSYEQKHNEENGEDNRDGHGHNLSCHWGVEGPSEVPEIRLQRACLQRAFLATLALSAGVPMVSHGDELSRTQMGNNNAYCQDGPLAWVHWQVSDDEDHRSFWAQAFHLRRTIQHLLSRDLLEGRAGGSIWLDASGRPLATDDWSSPNLRVIGWWRGSALLLFNASQQPVRFHLPEHSGRSWEVALESVRAPDSSSPGRAAGTEIKVPAHSLTALVAGAFGNANLWEPIDSAAEASSPSAGSPADP